VSALGILNSEWIKLRTLRSTVWTLVITVVVSIGLPLLTALAISATSTDVVGQLPPGFTVSIATSGLTFAQLSIAVLGALIITGEYSTGMIRSTFAAVPRRWPALAAKAVVLFVVTFIVGAISTFASYFIVAPILSGAGMASSITDDGVALQLLGGALYLACVSLLALAIGTILRNSAGGIAVALGILLVLPIILAFIPLEWVSDLSRFLFSNAGGNFASAGGGEGQLEFWQNLVTVIGWLVVTGGVALLLLKKRDA
jgi:ABC-2 type transport system permease protein